MKAFEKKFKEQFPNLFPIKKQSDFVFRRAYKDGWGDALEWMLNNIHTDTDGLEYIDPWDVREELEQ